MVSAPKQTRLEFEVSQVPKGEESPPHGRRPVRGDPGPGAPSGCWDVEGLASGAKALFSSEGSMYGLKPVPFMESSAKTVSAFWRARRVT